MNLLWRHCVFVLIAVLGISLGPSDGLLAVQTPAVNTGDGIEAAPEATIRIATFNISFHRRTAGKLKEQLTKGKGKNFHRIAKIIQTVRPDVLLLNEFDYDPTGQSIASFQKHFLEQPHDQLEPIRYPHVFSQTINTGVDTGLDLNGDGKTQTGNDAYGYGLFPGQYGMVVLSKLPLDQKNIRTFQKFIWQDMPEAAMPVDPKTKQPFYKKEAREIFRLSSKSHWDVPIMVGETRIHFLVSHPTPPAFDGPEDRNGKRNHDEIRLWADYISNDAKYLYDDQGVRGGLPRGSHFVIAGDLNADPVDGDSYQNAIKQLLGHPAVNAHPAPRSLGGPAFAEMQGKSNDDQQGDPAFDTADFGDRQVGNLRVDYCLPSKTLTLQSQAVFWPKPDQAAADWIKATDHRMVYIDIAVP